jgi:hypothetical protein
MIPYFSKRFFIALVSQAGGLMVKLYGQVSMTLMRAKRPRDKFLGSVASRYFLSTF